MLKTRTIAILIGLLGALPALSEPGRVQAPPPDNDRVPNKDPWQMYPRWTLSFPFFINFLGSNPAVAGEMALQQDGTAHFLLKVTSGSTRQILYSNNRPETRGGSGFSTPFVLHNGTRNAYIGDITVGNDGRLTALYFVETGSGLVWVDLWARQFDPVAKTWGSAVQLTSGSSGFVGNDFITITYNGITAAYDSAGNVHVVYLERYHLSNSQGQQDKRTVFYSLNLGAPEVVETGTTTLAQSPTGELPAEQANTGSRAVIPVVAVGPNNVPQVLWQHQFIPGTSSQLRHAARSGPGSWPMTVVSQESGDFDLSIDDSNTAHIAYLTLSQATYRSKPFGGAITGVETLPMAPGEGASQIKISVNSRKLPSVLFANSSGTNLVAKVQNSVANQNGWVEQSSLDGTGNGARDLIDMAIDRRTGFIHVIDGGGNYYRSTELNTGVQDGFTMIPFGPGTTANAATGNLRFELPLFNARSGAGFGTSFSLRYNSLDGERGTLSPGWSTSFDIFLADFQCHMGEGRIIPFSSNNPFGIRLSRDEFGLFYRLDDDPLVTDGHIITTKFGIKYFFDATGRLSKMTDTQSPPNTMVFEYANGLLTAIHDSTFRNPTTLIYDGSNRLQKVTDPAGNTYTLAYQAVSGPNPVAGNLETVTFDGAPAGQTVTWKFQYHTEDNFDQSANPPLERHKGMLSDIFTPRGQASSPKYSYLFGYKLDGRVVSCTEPQEQSVINDTLLSGLSTSTVAARQEMAYTDPAGSFSPPYVDEGPTGTRVSPAAEVRDRRGNVTTIEYQAMRCLADRIRDPLVTVQDQGLQGSRQVLRRFFDTFQQQQDDPNNPFITVPRYRNLKKLIDREGNTSQYFYTFEEGTQESPAYVRDNLRRVSQPGGNSSDPAGTTGAQDSQTTVTYTYKDFFARVATVADVFGNTTTYGYDTTTGNLLTIIYPQVGAVQASEFFVYDAAGRVTSHTAPEGGITNYLAFDGFTGLPTSIKQPEHTNPEAFEYDRMGNTTRHTLPEGGVTLMTYNNLYQLKDTTPPAGGTGDTPSQSTVYTYNEDSQVIQVDAPENSGSMSVYDHLGRLLKSQTKSSSGTFDTLYKYDRDGNTREVKDPNLKVSSTMYDELSRSVKSHNPGPPAVISVTTYTLNGAVATQKVGSSLSSMTYSGRGLLLKSSNTGFASQTDETQYFEDGTVDFSSHKVNGVVTNQSNNGYDNRRRLISTLQVADLSGGTGPLTTYTLDRDGNRTSVTDPDGRVSFMEYDKADRHTVTRDHNGAFLSRNTYDQNDRVSQRTKADPQTGAEITDVTYTYNARNELKTQTDAATFLTSFAYDARGNQLSSTPPTVPGGSANTVHIYDVAGRLVQETRAAGSSDPSIWLYEYDSNGNRTKITDPRGFVYIFKYDDSNRLIELDYPTVAQGSFAETWTYDDRGNLLTHTDCEGKVATMTYDLLNRMKTEVHVKNGQTLASIQKDYDERGNLVYVWDSVSRILVAFAKSNGSTAYDSLGRLTEVNWYLEATSVSFSGGTLTQSAQFFKRVAYQKTTGDPGYDGSGNLTDMLDPEGHRYQYTYDSNGRLDEVRRTPSAGSQGLLAKTTYYPSGLKKDVTYQGGSKQTWTYNSRYLLQSIVLKNPSAVEIGRIDYAQDARGRVTSANHPLLNRLVGYSYDLQDRLTGEQWTSGAAPPPSGGSNNIQNLVLGNFSAFTDPVCATPSASNIVYTANWFYDASGNRTQKSVNGVATDYEYDQQNRLQNEKRNGSVVVSYGYDKNGNQLTRVEGGVTETFLHDYRNRVKAYTKGSTVSYSYIFTPTDERIAKVNVAASTEEWSMYDGQDVTSDYSRTTGGSTFSGTRTYANGRGIDSKIARIESNGTVYFYSGDMIGSVSEMFSSTGTLARRSLYTAWGEDLGDAASEIAFAGGDRYAFTQRENDSESALMHYRARSEDPRIGRFTQRDLLPGPNGLCTYTYAGNLPTVLRDPEGLQTDAELDAAAATAWAEAIKYPATELAKIKNGLGGAFEKELIKEVTAKGWNASKGLIYTDVRLAKLPGGDVIVKSFASGNGLATGDRIEKTVELLQDEVAQYDVIRLKPGCTLKAGERWDWATKGDGWYDAYTGNNPTGKLETASMGRKKDLAGGTKGRLLTKAGLMAILGASVGITFGLGELASANEFDKMVKAIDTNNTKGTKVMTDQVYEMLVGKDMKQNAALWQGFALYVNKVVARAEAFDYVMKRK